MRGLLVSVFLFLSLCASVADAQRAIVIQLPTGKYVGIAYLENGQQIILSDVQVLKIPENPTLPPVTPNLKVNRVTYVYEKDQGGVPPGVAAALMSLNAAGGGIIATDHDDDTTDGDGQIPDQYKIAVAESQRLGIPLLVIQAGNTIVKTIKPTPTITKDEVLRIVAEASR